MAVGYWSERLIPASLRLLDANVAIPDSFGFVLEADVALGWPVLEFRLTQVEILNLLSVQDDLQMVAF